jgi:hypothetical protein
MRRAALIAFAFAALSPLAATAPASAQKLSLACELEETPDGFVALHAGPSPKAAPILKMKPTDTIYLVMKGRTREERGGWLRIAHVAENDATKKKTFGWMWGKLLAGCDM